MIENLFSDLPKSLPSELCQCLAAGDGVRIERIVSTGHRSPAGYWYDQEEAEWVTVLRGEAVLRFADRAESVKMVPGDFVDIPPHCRHRVDGTSPNEPTVWLAVFYKSSPTPT